MSSRPGAHADAELERPAGRILWLAPYSPWPPEHGGKLRLWNVLTRLANSGFVVDLLYVDNTSDQVPPNHLGLSYKSFKGRQRVGLAGKLAATLSPLPESSWATVNRRLLRDMAKMVSQYELVVFEQAHMAAYMRRVAGGIPTVLVAQNVEHLLMRQFSKRHEKRRYRLHYRLETIKSRRLERRAFDTASHIFAMSEPDAVEIRKLAPRAVVSIQPNGVDLNKFAGVGGGASQRPTLIMTGTLGYLPNLDAALWMRSEVLPLVRTKVPDAELCLIGNSAPESLLNMHDPTSGFHVVGWVPDVRPAMAAADVFIIPLRMGSGTRLKAFEAMASGLPVVGTRVGLEGIEGGVDPPFVIADTAQDLANAVVTLLQDPQLRRALGRRGEELVRSKYTWEALAERQSRVFLELAPKLA